MGLFRKPYESKARETLDNINKLKESTNGVIDEILNDIEDIIYSICDSQLEPSDKHDHINDINKSVILLSGEDIYTKKYRGIIDKLYVKLNRVSTILDEHSNSNSNSKKR